MSWISGGTISGNWATGNPRIATRPNTTKMIEMTMATMGRLIKKRAIVIYLFPLSPGAWWGPSAGAAVCGTAVYGLGVTRMSCLTF